VAAGKVRGHHQILVIRQTYRLTRPGLERTRITNDLQSMPGTMARQGGLSDYALVAAPMMCCLIREAAGRRQAEAGAIMRPWQAS
jgi:hypothetical protein